MIKLKNQTMQYIYQIICLSLVFISILFSSCNADETISTDAGARLEYSLDTVAFDTVFTSIGSATKTLKIINPNKDGIRIDKIAPKAENSPFRFNVDGIAGSNFADVVVPGEDSIYIFIEVTVDPDQDVSVSPFFIEDALTIDYNGNSDAVELIAWGQNANYFPSFQGQGLTTLTTCKLNDLVWDDPKPYVLYGILVIDSCNLIIPAGARIHVWGGLARAEVNGNTIQYNDGLLVFGANGSLEIQGTAENPVTISGTRLEASFAKERGQWSGIRALAGSSLDIAFATIEHPNVGIYADSGSVVRLNNTIIQHTGAEGIVGVSANISAQNSLIHNNSSHSFASVFGGQYDFKYCTLANYGNNASSVRLLNFRCDADNSCFAFPLQADFTNCIIAGSQADELIMEDALPGEDFFKYSFKNCILRYKDLGTKEPFLDFESTLTDCINLQLSDSLFINESEDYHLSPASIAIGKAIPLQDIATDLENNQRDDTPDIGCYEATK